MPYAVRVVSATRATATAGGTATITIQTDGGHPFKTGDKVNLYGLATDAGTVGFSQGNPYTVSNLGTSITESYIGGAWVQTGYSYLFVKQGGLPANYQGASATRNISISAGTAIGNTRNTFQITTSQPHNLPVGLETKNIGIQGVTGLSTGDLTAINQPSLPARVISGSVIEFRCKPVTTFAGAVWTTGSAYFPPTAGIIASADSINAISGVAGASGVNTTWSAIRRSVRETDAVRYAMGMVCNFMALEFPLQRLCFPFDGSKITTTRIITPINITQPPSKWRSVMDSIVETYQGADGKKRRYWIDADGIFNYDIIDDTKPATANAPYKIVTNGPGTPNSTTDSSVAAFDLTLGVDHDTVKRALFSAANGNGQPISDFVRYDSTDALGTAATRLGAAVFDDIVEYPTGTSASLISRQTGAKSFFLEHASPMTSGQFTLRGAGTAAWNSLGFNAGYATVSSPTSVTLPVGGAYTEGGTDRQVTAFDFANIVPGMQIVVSGFVGGWFSNATAFNGTATVTSVGRKLLTIWETGLPIKYAGTASLPGALGPFYAMNSGDAQVQVSGLFVRTGTAPSQIVTVTLPLRHKLSNGATVTVSGLTGTAGSTMNGTVTATIVDDYSFTYPSTGTNGTAGGSAVLSSVTLVPNWQPGQWVDITAPDFGLSGLYRVEQVDWRLEPGSFQQAITITFNRRNGKLLTRMLRKNNYFG